MPFELVTGQAINKLIVSIWAAQKRGKTHLALTFPEPIYLFDWDLGSDEVIPKFPGKQIYRVQYPMEVDASVDDYREMWGRYVADLKWLEKNYQPGGTVVQDTGTHIWQIIQKIDLDVIKQSRKSKDIYPFDYADANVHFVQVQNFLKRLDLNMVLLHRARAIYDSSGNKTERLEAQENGQVPYLVQTVLRLYQDPEDGLRKALVESCRTSPTLEGMVIEKPTYDRLKALLLP